MKKFSCCFIFSIVFSLFINTHAFADENDLYSLDFYNFPEEVYAGELIEIGVNVKCNEPGITASAEWQIDGNVMAGYFNNSFQVYGEKQSVLTYQIPREIMQDTKIKISFIIRPNLESNTEPIIIEKEIKVLMQPVLIKTKIISSPTKVYLGEKFKVEALTEVEYGKSVSAQAYWTINGKPVVGFVNNSFLVKGNKQSVFEYEMSEIKASEITIGFHISFSDGSEINDYKKIKTLKQKAENVSELVRKVQIEATIVSDCILYKDQKLKEPIGKIKKADIGTYLDYSEKDASKKLYFANGLSGWIQGKFVKVNDKNYTVFVDITAEKKESFINTKRYTSRTKYLIWINLERQKVNIFKNVKSEWEIIYSAACSSGKNDTPTISGVFKYSRYVDRWDFGEFHVRNVMIFNGGAAFHSQTYKPNGKLLDPTLGRPVSHGCIRLKQADINWMAAKIPIGTTVVVY